MKPFRWVRERWQGWRLHRHIKTGKKTWGRQTQPMMLAPGKIGTSVEAQSALTARIVKMEVRRADGSIENYDGTGKRVS